MTTTTNPIVDAAQRIADDVLFPAALDSDAADLLPRHNLDALADAGLYGLYGPAGAGGLNAGPKTAADVVEALASGCMTTTFVYVQHHRAVITLATSPNQPLRDEWLPALCSGERRSGVAFSGLRIGPSELAAERTDGGWLLDGVVPLVTGWGHIDVVLAIARSAGGQVVRTLIDAETSDSLHVRPLRLLATSASGTVEMTFERHFVPDERIAAVEPYVPPPPHDAGGRMNGSLALGVARRCIALGGPGPLETQLDAVRRRLDAASEYEMPDARAAACELAVRAAAHLIVTRGSRSLLLSEHAQRLSREAAFCLVFGLRPALRESLRHRLSISPPAGA